jgi:hypothetical protein
MSLSSSPSDGYLIDISTNSTPPVEPIPVGQRCLPDPLSIQPSNLTPFYREFLIVAHVRAISNSRYAKYDSGLIQCCKDDIITVHQPVGEHWLKGSAKDEIRIFPTASVEKFAGSA